MKTKPINAMQQTITGLAVFILGLIILNTGMLTLRTFFYVFGIVFLFMGSSKLLGLILSKIRGIKSATSFVRICIDFAIGFLIIRYPGMPVWLFGIVCGLYALLNATIRFVNFYILRKNHAHGQYKELIVGIAYFVFGVFLLFSPMLYVSVVVNIIAVFFILYGFWLLHDGIRLALSIQKKNDFKRKIRITLPTFIEFLIPTFVLGEINKALQPSDVHTETILSYEERKSEEHTDVEVLVHMSEEGFGRVGHVDLAYKDRVISYGNYDPGSWRMFELIGDGVIFTTEKEGYLPFVIADSKKTLVGFGLKLNENQLQAMGTLVDQLMDNTIKWVPPFYVGLQDFYASRLNYHVPTNFYKVRSGRFHTFFVVGDNCVRFVDRLLGATGIDLIKLYGIITPGSYYEYLNNEFANPNGFVVNKRIYSSNVEINGGKNET
ncbi:hypothetical protein A4S06_07770 [Erysipelotrichaceae bacterium MTC7]|nr:hypothetical protein A4S06_07770 [Erysipelotrichaceae bacterium MTC7]